MSDLSKKNIDFYNDIAKEYDSHHQDRKDESVRNFVKNYLLRSIKPCHILDFGGGTGMDLSWLIENNFSVTFCEPAEKMRAIAMKKVNALHTDKVYFLNDDKNNFELWADENLPFPKADCVLADFNVINSIADPEMLFRKLKIVLNPGAHFIGTMLNMRLVYRIKMKPFRVFNSAFQKRILEAEKASQIVYRHTPGHLRKAAKPFFSLHRMIPVPDADFLLFDFITNA